MRPDLVGQPNAVQLREHLGLTTGLLANMRPELVGRLNVVPITGISIPFQAVLFSLPFQGTLFPEKEPFKRPKMEEKALTTEPILDPRRKIEEIQRLEFERGEN
uniref:Predicted protein n=1 Tax=Physcomitrium patens TaxID=3218 RepID=A9U565_PHYPA